MVPDARGRLYRDPADMHRVALTDDRHDRPTEDDLPEPDRGNRTGSQLGPKATSDDATLADMGLGGPPAESTTPEGQGEEEGVGAADRDQDDRRG